MLEHSLLEAMKPGNVGGNKQVVQYIYKRI